MQPDSGLRKMADGQEQSTETVHLTRAAVVKIHDHVHDASREPPFCSRFFVAVVPECLELCPGFWMIDVILKYSRKPFPTHRVTSNAARHVAAGM